MRHNKDVGRKGEDIAAEYVDSLGMIILERNWHCSKAELDIIAIKDFTLRIIEVKSRNEECSETISNSLDKKKLRQLEKGAAAYFSEHKIEGISDTYFDLITVIFTQDGGYRIEYIPQFFYPSW